MQYLVTNNRPGNIQSLCIIMNKFKGKRQSRDCDSKMIKELFSLLPGFEPKSSGTESQCATKRAMLTLLQNNDLE